MIITDSPYESLPAANHETTGEHCHPPFYFEDNDSICTGSVDTVHCTDLSCDKSSCEIESDCDECHSNSTDCSTVAPGTNEMPLDIVAAAAAFIAHESENSCCMQQPLLLPCGDCPLPGTSAVTPASASTLTSCGAGITSCDFNTVYQPRVSNSRPNRPYQHHPVSCCPSTVTYRKPIQTTMWTKRDSQPAPSIASSTSNESMFSSRSNSVYSTHWTDAEDYQQTDANSEILKRNEINNSSCASINNNGTSDTVTATTTNDDNNSSGTNSEGYIDFDNHSSTIFRGQPPRLLDVETSNSNSAKRHFEEVSKDSPYNWEHCTGEFSEINSLLEHLKKDHSLVIQQQTPPISQTNTPNWDSSGGLYSPSVDNTMFSSQQHHQKHQPLIYSQQEFQQNPQKRPRQGSHYDHPHRHLQNPQQSTQPRVFQCEWKDCNFSCQKVELFMTHIRLAHVQGMVGNMITPSVSSSRPSSLSENVGTDITESPISSETHICLWENENTNDDTAQITVCQKAFGSTQILNQHVIESHIGLRKNNYVCRWRDCDRHKRPFSQRQKIHRHLITHTKHKPYTCDVCNNSFSEAVVLKQHMRVHSGERPFPCKVCGKRFAASTAVSVHMRTHTGEKPLKCRFEGCEKRFSESSNLAKHMKTHLVEKKYGCAEPNCTKRFVRHDQLQRHLKTHENRLIRKKLKQEATAALVSCNLKNATL